MTITDDRPSTGTVGDPSPVEPVRRSVVPGWRLAARLARRETRRRPGRTLLAALLIAVPVLAMTVGSVMARTNDADWAAQFERRYGNADIAVDTEYSGGGPFDEDLVSAPALPAGTAEADYLWTYSELTPVDGVPADGPIWAAVSDLSLDEPEGARIEIRSGEPPQSGEVLLTGPLASELGVGIGDEVSFERPSGTWTVSGIGRIRDDYRTAAIVMPDLDRDRIVRERRQVVTLYALPADTPPATVQATAAEVGGVTALVDPYGAWDADLRRSMAWGWVGGVLALVAVGIIVAAAFATSARRQLVTVGQLASNGASPGVIRRTLALQGTWTAAVGVVVGIVAGLAALPLARPVIEQVIGHDIGGYQIAVTDLIVIAVTALIAGTIAASVPARSISRIPVMSALAGRRPLGKPPRWLVPVGLALLAGGLALVAIASVGVNGSNNSGENDLWALVLIVGVMGVVFGMCCATPLVVEQVGRLGGRMSLSWRLALRSLARSRTRSAAVVAAIAVAVGGAVAAAAITEAVIQDRQYLPAVPADAVVVMSYHDPGIGEEPIDLAPLDDAELSDGLRDDLLAIVPDATFATIRSASIDPPLFDPNSTGIDGFDGLWPQQQGPTIADDPILDLFDISRADRELLEREGALQPTSPYGWFAYGTPETLGPTRIATPFATEDGVVEVESPIATTPYEYELAGSMLLMTEQYADELGFGVVDTGLILRNDDPLSAEQRDQLRWVQTGSTDVPSDAFIEPGDPPRIDEMNQQLASDGFWIQFDEPEWRDSGTDIWLARGIIAAATVLLSLLVVAIGLSLAAAEGRHERDVLVVVGARPASLRRQAAARAVVLSLTGIALGIPTGFVPAWLLYRIVNTDNDVSSAAVGFPWLMVTALVVTVPALVAAAAWAGSGIAQRVNPVRPTHQD